MTGLLITVLVLFGFCMLKATIIIEYTDDVALTVRVLGIPIRILPGKKKHVKPMTAKEAAKIREKRQKAAEKKRQKAIAKAKKKKEKKKAAAEKKKAETATPEARRKAKDAKRKKKEQSATLGENLDLVGKIVGFFFSRFFGHLRIHVTRLRITIGTEEASKTAILYGVAVQGVAYILSFLDRATNLKGLKKADVDVVCDFLSEEIKVDVKIAFSIRIWHLFHLIFGSLKRLIINRLHVRARVSREHPNASYKQQKNPPAGHRTPQKGQAPKPALPKGSAPQNEKSFTERN